MFNDIIRSWWLFVSSNKITNQLFFRFWNFWTWFKCFIPWWSWYRCLCFFKWCCNSAKRWKWWGWL